MAISVVVAVGDKTADRLIEILTPKIKALKIGAGINSSVEMGPLVTKEHLEKVKSYVDLGVQEKATLVIDGRNFRPSDSDKGFYMGACLFDNVKPSMRIYREEIFGPVLSIVRVKNLEEAIKLINDHEYGNGTAIFTSDGYSARTFANQIQVGMVGINVPIPVPVAYHSFGGWKRSIFADIHMHGSEGIRFYTRLKTITQRWPKHVDVSSFTMPTH
jgi:malonate-semialdehyde dehydrogenase (acetylating)/methylmalonate-semialdehyde dehydrogenase